MENRELSMKKKHLSNRISALNKEQETFKEGMQLLSLRRDAISRELPAKVKLAMAVKQDAQKAYILAQKNEAFMNLMFSLVSVAASVGFGATSFNLDMKKMGLTKMTKDVAKISRVKAKIDLANTLTGMASLRTPVIIKNSKKLKNEASGIGCPTPDIVETFAASLKQSTPYEDFLIETLLSADNLIELKRLDSSRSRNQFKRTLHCVLSQNIDYQKTSSVEAEEVDDLIDEYFEAEEKMSDLGEKFYSNQKSLETLKSEKHQLDQYGLSTNTRDNRPQYRLMEAYQQIEFLILYDLSEYTAHLENKYLKCFGLNPHLVEILKKPLKLPMSESRLALLNLIADLTNWRTRLDQKSQFVDASQEVHLVWKSQKLLNRLKSKFSLTLEIPQNRNNLPSDTHILNDVYFGHDKLKLTSIYARLQISQSGSANLPEKVWITIGQDQVSNSGEFQCEGNQNRKFITTNPMNVTKFFTVGLGESKALEETQEALNEPDCCLENCAGLSDGEPAPTCQSPFSAYHIWINRGRKGGPACGVGTEDEYNCRGLSLEGLQAIELTFKYKFIRGT